MQRFTFPTGSPMRLNGRCPVCSSSYNFQNVRVLGEREQQILTYIQCSHCGSGVVSILTMNPFGLKASGIITDLSADEVVELEESDEVTDEDVLSIHELMESDDATAHLLRSNRRKK